MSPVEPHLKVVETPPCDWGRRLRKAEGPPLPPCPWPAVDELVVIGTAEPVSLHFCGEHMEFINQTGLAKPVPPSGEQ